MFRKHCKCYTIASLRSNNVKINYFYDIKISIDIITLWNNNKRDIYKNIENNQLMLFVMLSKHANMFTKVANNLYYCVSYIFFNIATDVE